MNNKKTKIIILVAVLVVVNLCAIIFYPREKFPETFAEAKNGVVCVATDSGWGSGFAIGKSGEPVSYIVTNYHVVSDEYGEKADSVTVYFSAAANRYVSGQVYRYDANKDIAVIRLPEPTSEVEPLKIMKSTDADINKTHYALGFPGRAVVGNDFLKFDKTDIVTTSGIISKQTMVSEVDVYMLDIEITHGNSGGPLVNEKGEVVGINTFSITDSSHDTSYYAVCIDELLRMINVEEVPYTTTEDVNKAGILVAGIDVVISIVIVTFLVIVATSKKNGTRKNVQAVANVDRSVKNEKTSNDDILRTVAVGNSMPVLKCIAGAVLNQEFVVEKEVYIGRDPKRCDIVLPVDAEGVSGYHCKIVNNNGKLMLEDLGSTYGTYINKGLKVSKDTSIEVAVGDEFYLGSENTKFRVIIR